MKIYKKLLNLFIIFCISGSLFVGCNEMEDTGSIYDPNILNTATSVQITDVDPETAGSTSEITIKGSGFAEGIDNNWVYFNNVPAVIKSLTSSEIVVYRPDIVSDSIKIKVASSGVVGQGIYANNYPMEAIIDTFNVFLQNLDKITNFCVDKDDYVYLLFFRTSEIRKFNSLGKEDSTFAPVTGSSVLYALDIKEGPEDYIYFLRKQGSRTRIYRFDENAGGEPESYERVSGSFASFDYDQNGHMYLGGRDGLKLLKSDLTEVDYDMYDDFIVKTVRVYNDELYVLAEYTGADSLNNPSGLYKNQITSTDGQLETTNTLVLDWNFSGDYLSSFYNSFTISEFGEIYVATDFEDPILSLIAGDVSKLYYGLLSPEVNRMMWGGGNNIYLLLNSGSTYEDGNYIQIINMGKSGAPLHGRDL